MKREKLSIAMLGALVLIVLYILCRSELSVVLLGVALIFYFLLRMLFQPCKIGWVKFATTFIALFLMSTFPDAVHNQTISEIWIVVRYLLLAVVLAYDSLYLSWSWEEGE